MYIAEIKLAGRFKSGTTLPAAFATISRKPGEEYIRVLLLTETMEREHFVAADCEQDIQSMAECLQYHLDDCKGTGSMIYEYLQILQKFAD